mgnify:CR=1 FL=1
MLAEPLQTELEQSAAATRILVIDDSAVIRRAASKMLNAEFDVVVANDGEEGWQLIQEDHSISVVFTDINMPVLDGYDLIERVRTCDDEGIRNLPLIVITSEDAQSGAKEKVYKLGATDFISKPFNSFDLKARAKAHSDYQRIHKVLQEQAFIEPVSGLLNAKGLQEQLDKEVSRAIRESQHLAAFQVEVSNFKEIFLRVGRESADKIIQIMAKKLLDLVRKEDSVARLNLSTFTIISPAAAPESAFTLAYRMRDAITSIKATVAGEALIFDMHIGVCTLAGGNLADTELMLVESRHALKQAKHSETKMVAVRSIQNKLNRSFPSKLSIDKMLLMLESGNKRFSSQQLLTAKQQLQPLLALFKDI